MRASSALRGLKAAMMQCYAFAAKCFNKHEQRRIMMKILVMGAGAVGNYFGGASAAGGRGRNFLRAGSKSARAARKGPRNPKPQGRRCDTRQGDRRPARICPIRSDPFLRKGVRYRGGSAGDRRTAQCGRRGPDSSERSRERGASV